jgi:RHS repeat-associated protein
VKPGYTGHEMLDDVGIIHMNGRIYDPEIGRMLSPDPIIQAPDNTQSYNAYCYVMNNPMRFTDPSGYSWFGDLFKSIGKFFKKVWKGIKKAIKKSIRWVKKNWKTVVTVVVAVVLIVVTYGVATAYLGGISSFWGAVAMGAASGAAMGAVQTAIAGGSWSDIGKAALTGAAVGAASAALGYGLGKFFDKAIMNAFAPNSGQIGKGILLTAGRAAGDGLVGGGLSELTGGNFKDGFIGAVVGSALSPVAANTHFGRQVIGGTRLGRTAFAAVVGGTAAELTGGKFANGAVTAAFMHIVNAEIGRAYSDPEAQAAYSTVGENPLHWQDSLERSSDLQAWQENSAKYAGQDWICVMFDPSSTFDGDNAQGQMGTAMWYDSAGQLQEAWTVSSGGSTGRADLAGTMNRVPNGHFKAGIPGHGEYYPMTKSYTYTPGRSDSGPGFYRHGYSFKYEIFNVPGRNGILFHPSSGWTEGCIGLNCSLTSMSSFNSRMISKVGGGRRLSVVVR